MTATPNRWRATVLCASNITTISDGQADALVRHLPGYGVAGADGRHLRLEMTVEASTLRKATDEALRAAAAAYAAAFDTAGVPTGLRVVTEEESERELTAPGPLDLVGVSDIRVMASTPEREITQQRASQIVARPDFPPPVGRPGGRPVWARRSVELWLERWARVGGWAGHHAAGGTAAAG